MARLPRLSLAAYPHLVIQRGNNGQAIASSATDYQRLLALLDEAASKFAVAIHGYVLTSNQFQLLATPATDDGLPKMMQAVGRSYVRYFNDLQGRSGTLWEGRYRCTLMDADRYLLACMVYLDLMPVQEGLAMAPQDYLWSSHGNHVGSRSDKTVTPHALFWALGNTPFAREAAYAELVKAGISAAQHDALTQAALGGWALGDESFVADLQKLIGRRVSKTSAGRPPKPAEALQSP